MSEVHGELGSEALLSEAHLTVGLKRAQRSYRWWSLSVMPAVILSALLLVSLIAQYVSPKGTLVGLVGIGLCVLCAIRAGAVHQARIAEVTRCGDPTTLGDLIESLALLEQGPAQSVLTYSAALLRDMGPEDSNLLNLRQRAILYRLLVPRPLSFRPVVEDREFLLAAVQALTTIGDVGALPTLERLATEAEDLNVRAAARESLPALHACKAHGLLLHPSSEPQTHERLLRTSSGNAFDPQQMLRSSEEQTSRESRV